MLMASSCQGSSEQPSFEGGSSSRGVRAMWAALPTSPLPPAGAAPLYASPLCRGTRLWLLLLSLPVPQPSPAPSPGAEPHARGCPTSQERAIDPWHPAPRLQPAAGLNELISECSEIPR